MKFEFVELRNFRNFKDVKLDLGPSINVFLGENGQGKTNLLESVYFMTHGESFRPGVLETFLKNDDLPKAHQALVRGKVCRKQKESALEVRFEMGRKIFFVDQKKAGAGQLAKNFPAVLFSPESLASIKQGPEQRRNLVDEFLSNSTEEGKQLIANYRRVLRARNRLLKDHLKGLIEPDEFQKMLESLNASFFDFGSRLVKARMRALQNLHADMNKSMKFLMNAPELAVDFSYLISEEPALGWSSEQVYDSIRNRAIALGPAEIASGTSLVGPHKHDIQILFNGQDSRYYCSQGQQRALILSFKMAQIVYHYEVYQTYPVLLLDDVMSELDLEKRRRLVDFLSGIQAQILITTTDFDLSEKFSTNEVRIFRIDSGRVSHAKSNCLQF